MKKILKLLKIAASILITALYIGNIAVHGGIPENHIISRYSFESSWDYVVISEESYKELEQSNFEDVFKYIPDSEKTAFANKVNSDFKGKIFDEKGAPLSAYYVDYYSYIGMKKPAGAKTKYLALRAYDSKGERIYDIGIPKYKPDGTLYYLPITRNTDKNIAEFIENKTNAVYVPITRKMADKIFDEARTVINDPGSGEFKETVKFINADIKTGEITKDYKLTKIIMDDRYYDEPNVKMVFLFYTHKKQPDKKITVFCEKANGVRSYEDVVLINEPKITKIKGVSVYEFDTSTPVLKTLDNMFKWRNKDLVYSMNYYGLSESEVKQILNELIE